MEASAVIVYDMYDGMTNSRCCEVTPPRHGQDRPDGGDSRLYASSDGTADGASEIP